MGAEAPKPGRSTAITSRSSASRSSTGSHTTSSPPSGGVRTSGSPLPRRTWLSTRSAPVGRAREQGLHVADAPLAEAALGVGQIQLPQSAELQVVAELGGAPDEVPPPAPQRLGV